jgi:hypothetical protein
MIRDDESPYLAESLALEESDKRLQELQDRRDAHANQSGKKLMKAGALAVATGALVLGVNKYHSSEQPATPKADKMEIVTTANGHESHMAIATKNATPGQLQAQAVKENGGNLPGTP